jgi:tetratricopeptide (TPR) repeat protein
MAAVRCRSCGRVWQPAAVDQPCPSCGSVDREIAAGPAKGRRWWLAAVVLAAVGIGFGVWIAARPRPGEQTSPGTDESADALNRQSDAAARAGDYREALALAERAVRAAPESAPGYVRRARARYFLGDTEGALADCDEAIRRDPTRGLAYAHRAPVAWLRNPPAAGVRDGERAVELLPDSAEALTGLALARVQAGDPAGAVTAATRAIEKAPDDPEPYRARGLARAARGEAAAADDFDAAVRRSGDRPFYLVARANSLIRSVALHPKPGAQALQRADEDIDRALRADPASAVAHLAAANLQAIRERRADVLAACEKAVAANPRLVEAYLRAAEDLSPRQLRHYEMLQAALSQTIDLRELMGGDFAFGSLFDDIHRLVAAGMTQEVPVRVVTDTFPEKDRAMLREARVNLSSLMDATGDQLLKKITFKTILDVICRQVGGSIRVTPEAIEVVGREAAAREAGRTSRVLSYDLVAPADLYRREERAQLFEDALRQTIDLEKIKGRDNSLGARLTDIQRLVSNKMKADVALYINYDSFQPKVRPMIRDTQVKPGPVLDPQGNAPALVSVEAVLDQSLRPLGEHVRVRPTPDFVEIVWTGPPAGWEEKWRPQRHQPKPRTEAVQWLTRGIEQVPESARLYLARGQVLLEQYELDAAIADLTRALELNPADKRAYRLRSLAYAARSNAGDAPLARADALATKP